MTMKDHDQALGINSYMSLNSCMSLKKKKKYVL